ncbi:MAG: ATP-dependent 6-phosphofructokinase [Waterburya sp.]
MTEQKRIGILTSGGDCPGLNAVIHAVLKYSSDRGWNVYGIPNGTDGFIDIANGICLPEDFEIGEHTFDLPGQKGMNVLLFLSGSVVGCRGKKKERLGEREKILEGYQQLNLDALIVVGGDGSLEIINDLAEQGNWKLIAIPKTIDKDVPLTERVVGFDTAVDIVTNALYNLTFTAASHDRVMIVQVMGRDAGHLALHAGIAGGADVILIPELTPQVNEELLNRICHKIAQIRSQKRKFVLVVVAEGVKNAAGEKEENIGNYIQEKISEYRSHHSDCHQPSFCGLTEEDEIEMRVTVLGHLPRSSPPSSLDRLLAVQFGVKAMDLIAEEQFNQIVVWENGNVSSKPLSEVMEKMQQEKQRREAAGEAPCASPVDPDGFLVHTARALGLCLGDPAKGCIS